MKRRTFDVLMSAAGVVVTIMLIVAGGLAYFGYSFANREVRTQLTAQKIHFPEKGSEALQPSDIGRYLNQYAGQQLVTGEQAKAYADHFIAVHLKDRTGGKTYAELGDEQTDLRGKIAAAEKTDDPAVATFQKQLADVSALRETVFKGETLRGLLLNAYAFWKIGQLALVGSIVSFSVAGVMFVLTILGFWHAKRVSPVEEMIAPRIKARVAA